MRISLYLLMLVVRVLLRPCKGVCSDEPVDEDVVQGLRAARVNVVLLILVQTQRGLLPVGVRNSGLLRVDVTLSRLFSKTRESHHCYIHTGKVLSKGADK